MEITIPQEIDNSLKTNYHAICFNPQQKQTLHRFNQQRARSSLVVRPFAYSTRKQPQRHIDNQLVNNYIQYVYGKYNIEDPIDKQLRLSQMQRFPKDPQKQTPERIINKSLSQSQKNTSTKSKLQRMRKSYKHDSSDIMYTTQYQMDRTARQSQISAFRNEAGTKQIGYRTKAKIRFKTLTHEEDDFRKSFNTHRRVNHSFYLEQESVRQDIVAKKTQNIDNAQQCVNQTGEVPVKFRYCPMCEAVILEHNIKFHQASCVEIKRAYQLPLEDLQSIFTYKIKRIKDKICLELQEDESNKLQKHRKLNNSVADWLQNEDDLLLDSVKEQYHKLALDQYNLVTKLDWFKKLKAKIMNQRQTQVNCL